MSDIDKFSKYEQEAQLYGYSVGADGSLSRGDKILSVVLKEKGNRLRIEGPAGLIFSSGNTAKSFASFLERYYFAVKRSAPSA